MRLIGVTNLMFILYHLYWDVPTSDPEVELLMDGLESWVVEKCGAAVGMTTMALSLREGTSALVPEVNHDCWETIYEYLRAGNQNGEEDDLARAARRRGSHGSRFITF